MLLRSLALPLTCRHGCLMTRIDATHFPEALSSFGFQYLSETFLPLKLQEARTCATRHTALTAARVLTAATHVQTRRRAIGYDVGAGIRPQRGETASLLATLCRLETNAFTLSGVLPRWALVLHFSTQQHTDVYKAIRASQMRVQRLQRRIQRRLNALHQHSSALRPACGQHVLQKAMQCCAGAVRQRVGGGHDVVPPRLRVCG